MIAQVKFRLKPCYRRIILFSILSGLILSLSGCSTLAYYRQAAGGHLDIMTKRRPIAELIGDTSIPAPVREKLMLVQEIRAFASQSLLLPENGSYSSYANINRRYVVWNVFATPALSLEPVESCYLVVGCLSYRGYYREADAQTHANKLRATNHDVYVGGVAAYSTLGWFDDPVLNTMLYWDDRRLARLIFHELTHQLLYVKHDALFNESFATNFAEIGLQRWLASKATDGKVRSEAGGDERAREIEFISMIQETREHLASLYASSATDVVKSQRKKEAFNALAKEYTLFKQRWSNYAGYDEWMNNDLNNAKIASVVTYHSYDKAFRNLLTQANDRLDLFVEKVKAIASLEETARHKCLRALNEDESHQCEA